MSFVSIGRSLPWPQDSESSEVKVIRGPREDGEIDWLRVGRAFLYHVDGGICIKHMSRIVVCNDASVL